MDENLIHEDLALKVTIKHFITLSTGTRDIKQNKNEAIDFEHVTISALRKPKPFICTFDNFEDATHYTLVARSIPKALQRIFFVFQPISKSEYNEPYFTC